MELFDSEYLPFQSAAAAAWSSCWLAMSDIGRKLRRVFRPGNVMRRFDDKNYSPEQLRAELTLVKGKRVVRKAVSHEVGVERWAQFGGGCACLTRWWGGSAAPRGASGDNGLHFRLSARLSRPCCVLGPCFGRWMGMLLERVRGAPILNCCRLHFSGSRRALITFCFTAGIRRSQHLT